MENLSSTAFFFEPREETEPFVFERKRKDKIFFGSILHEDNVRATSSSWGQMVVATCQYALPHRHIVIKIIPCTSWSAVHAIQILDMHPWWLIPSLLFFSFCLCICVWSIFFHLVRETYNIWCPFHWGWSAWLLITNVVFITWHGLVIIFDTQFNKLEDVVQLTEK